MEFDKVTAQYIEKGIKDFEKNGFSVGSGLFSTFDMFQEAKGHITNQIFLQPVNGVINVQKIDMRIPPPGFRERQ